MPSTSGSKLSVYLDANASWPLDSAVRQRLPELLEAAGNPSSIHRHGQRCRAVLEEAREEVRKFVDAAPHDQIVFCAGATEANNLAVAQSAGLSAVSSAIEHHSVLLPVERLCPESVFVKPGPNGVLVPEALLTAVTERTGLVCLMLANNETGSIQPVGDVVTLLRERYPKVRIHCDAVQAAGRIPVSFRRLGVDFMTLSAHKVGALPGCGVLIARHGVPLAPLLSGGPQELKARAGTENVPAAAAFAMVLRSLAAASDERIERMRAARDRLESFCRISEPASMVIGREGERLPNTLSLFVPTVRADDLVVALDRFGVSVSSGAACSSGKPLPSHVLSAMGFESSIVRSTIRISTHDRHTEQELRYFEAVFPRAVAQCRAVYEEAA